MWILLIIVTLILSVYYSFKINFRNYNIKNIIKSIKKDKSSLFLSLGTKMGVGTIIGTVSSILYGGVLTLIMMYIFSLITSSLIYVEAKNGYKYRKKHNNSFLGGPYFIIRYGNNKKFLAVISILLLILTYSFLFQMMQTNTIISITNLINIPKCLIVFLIILILIFTVSFSIKIIINTMNKIVPFMCIVLIVLCLYGICNNYEILFLSIKENFIISNSSIITGILLGIKRSVFMNETLIGTTSLSSSIDENDLDTSINIQVFASYFISLIVSTLIACIVLIFMYNNVVNMDYIVTLINSFNYSTSSIGVYFLLIIVVLFGITTILSGYYIGKSNIEYLANSKKTLTIFKILFIIFSILGMFLKNEVIWKYIDILLFIMILINIYSIITLKEVYKCDRK